MRKTRRRVAHAHVCVSWALLMPVALAIIGMTRQCVVHAHVCVSWTLVALLLLCLPDPLACYAHPHICELCFGHADCAMLALFAHGLYSLTIILITYKLLVNHMCFACCLIVLWLCILVSRIHPLFGRLPPCCNIPILYLFLLYYV